MSDRQQEMEQLIVRLFNHLDEQQRLIDSLFKLVDDLRAVALRSK